MKFIIVIAFIGILGALAAAGVFMLRGGRAEGGSKSGAMMRALAVRVGFSVALFVCVIFSFWMGWIQPSGLPVGR